MRLVIDRFEGAFAVCEREDRSVLDVPRASLPAGCREGDALEERNGVLVRADNSADRARIREKLDRLMKKEGRHDP